MSYLGGFEKIGNYSFRGASFECEFNFPKTFHDLGIFGLKTLAFEPGGYYECDGDFLLGGGYVSAIGHFKSDEIIKIPNGSIGIDDRGFEGMRWTKIEFPETLVRIESRAFLFADADSLVIPGNVKSVGTRAFDQASIRSLHFEEGFERLNYSVFDNAGIDDIYLPSSVVAVPIGCFDNMSGECTVHCANENVANLVQRSVNLPNIHIVVDS